MHDDSDEAEAEVPPELGQAGAVVAKAIQHLLGQKVPPVAIASALLGGALGLLSRSMADDAVIRVLENAADSVRSGELRDIH